jgi:iron-sulfur cluster repair protein YtfE (RIC family)
VTLGAPPEGEELVDLLLACHARIRKFLRLAFTLGARVELDPGEVGVQCLRYFVEAFPLHVRDEEDSLLPRLGGRSVALDVALAQMRAQHFEHERNVAELIAALRATIESPKDHSVRRRLALIASTLETDLEAHLVLEEDIVFPLINRALSPPIRRAIVSELRARRT